MSNRLYSDVLAEQVLSSNPAEQEAEFQYLKLAQEALDVQDACNLSGVAQGFARAMLKLRGLGLDTEACNTNAITRCWLDKLNQLAGIQSSSPEINEAFGRVVAMAEQAHFEWSLGRSLIDEVARKVG